MLARAAPEAMSTMTKPTQVRLREAHSKEEPREEEIEGGPDHPEAELECGQAEGEAREPLSAAP